MFKHLAVTAALLTSSAAHAQYQPGQSFADSLLGAVQAYQGTYQPPAPTYQPLPGATYRETYRALQDFQQQQRVIDQNRRRLCQHPGFGTFGDCP